jgi:hypothetical protein
LISGGERKVDKRSAIRQIIFPQIVEKGAMPWK